MNRLVPLVLACALAAMAQTIAVVNGRIVPVTTPPIPKGTLLIRDGRIAAIGARVQIPKGTRQIDAAGLSVYPGWIDGFSSLGLAEVPAISATVDLSERGDFNPAAEAWVAVNPNSDMIRVARANGVTTAAVAPRGGRIAGAASVLNLSGAFPREMAVLKQAGLVLQLPSLYEPEPGAPPGETLAARKKRGAAQLTEMRRYLDEARAYSEMRARGGAASDTRMEAMLPYVRGERPVVAVANDFRDIRQAVAFAGEYRLKLLLAGAADAWKVVDLLKANNVGVLYSGVHALPGRDESYDAAFSTPEALRKAGVRFALISRSAPTAYELPWQAATATGFGLPEEDALKALTIWPAQLLGVDKELGSLEVGKIANVFISRGDPLDTRSEVRHVLIGGREISLESRHTELYQRFRPAAATPAR
jgi:imidazolonepropionase-like amidohydrolase